MHQGQVGKLRDAARHWARGGKGDFSNAAREARDWGIPEEVAAQLEAEELRHECGVWPENEAALSAFLAVSTQWRIAPIGGAMTPVSLYWAGLDYGAVAAGLTGAGIAASPDLWRDLRVMEAAARDVLNGVSAEDSA